MPSSTHRASVADCLELGIVSANGSRNTVVASWNETACLRRLDDALTGSHSNVKPIWRGYDNRWALVLPNDTVSTHGLNVDRSLYRRLTPATSASNPTLGSSPVLMGPHLQALRPGRSAKPERRDGRIACHDLQSQGLRVVADEPGPDKVKT